MINEGADFFLYIWDTINDICQVKNIESKDPQVVSFYGKANFDYC